MSEGVEKTVIARTIDLLRAACKPLTGSPFNVALEAEKLAKELADLDAWTGLSLVHNEDHWVINGRNALTGLEQSEAYSFEDVGAQSLNLDACMCNQISRLGNAIDILANEASAQLVSQQAPSLAALSKEYRETVYALADMRDRGLLK